MRNPLYLGNIALWAGFAVTAQLLWLVPAIVLLLAFEYHAIVRWEEQLLAARLGDAYRDVRRRVSRGGCRHVRSLDAGDAASSQVPPRSRGAQTFFSERGTLIAIAVGFVLLCLKAQR